MEKQKTFTSFIELHSSDLNQITGGDWWKDVLNSIGLPSKQKYASGKQPLV